MFQQYLPSLDPTPLKTCVKGVATMKREGLLAATREFVCGHGATQDFVHQQYCLDLQLDSKRFEDKRERPKARRSFSAL